MTQLLPEGFRDRLPPYAGRAATWGARAMAVFASHGYARVQPPLAEFEASLAGQRETQRPPNRLRLTDPISQRTLALRSDMTMQVGRIAVSRLAAAPRPLRLAYQGQVLKLRAGQLNPDREMTQIGAELIGNDSVAAAREIVLVAIEALESAGVTGITIDLTLPDLVETLAEQALPLPADRVDAVRAELDMKDAGGLAALGAEAYLPLLSATGPFDTAIERFAAIDAGGLLRERIAALRTIADAVKGRASVTLDPTERHGFEYQSWFGFSIFAAGFVGSIGRGGTYRIATPSGDNSDSTPSGDEEVATGVSLYPDPLIDAAGGGAEETRRLFLPMGHDAAVAAQLRAEGWITTAALTDGDDAGALGCSHRLDGATVTPL